MDIGGRYNQETARAVRLISLVVPPVFVLYGLLVLAGVVPSTHMVNSDLALGISGVWMIISLLQWFKRTSGPIDVTIRVVTVHILALLSFVFIIGFAQPFAPLFVLIFLTTYLYFGNKGLIISVLSLIFTALADGLIRYPDQPSIIVENVLSCLTVIFIGAAVVGIISAQETKRQALLNSRRREKIQYERTLAIINNLSDAAFTVDEKGVIGMYNAAALELLDTNDDIKGLAISKLLKLTDEDNNPVKFTPILKAVDRATRRDDLSHSFKDGEQVRLEMNIAPIRGAYNPRKRTDEESGFIIIMRDVTKEKSLEDERDEFISVVSHELRTPITIVEGTLSNLDVLVNRPALPEKTLLVNSIKTAHTQVLYLAKMVNDLSTLSRAERGIADEPETIDVKEMLQKLHHQYDPEARNKKLHLDLDLGTRLGNVHVSRLYLEELLQNFITNAIKYTKTGSVTIIARRASGMVNFSVKDTGIGISRSDQSNVFNKFYRSEDYRIRETGGTGLGLYVSSKLARKLGTKINLSSRVNYGSEFSFSLPVEQDGPSK